MVNENNIPKTETVFELTENHYEIKTSQLSPAASSKIIRKWGGNYLSERGKEGYGPCHSCGNNNDFRLRIHLKNCMGGGVQKQGQFITQRMLVMKQGRL